MAERREGGMEAADGIVLLLGSGPGALAARDWADHPFDALVAINNAWRVREDWTHLIHPEDFPPDRRPPRIGAGQRIVTYEEYVPCQNLHGGVVHAGGTMAFTAGYWALARLRPRVLAYLGCDMVYPPSGPTHFYGTGTADPLRPDPTLRSLEAKSARLLLHAGRQGCRCVNISRDESRLVFPRAGLSDLQGLASTAPRDPGALCDAAEAAERHSGYFVESGRYWEEQSGFDPAVIDETDRLWREALARYSAD